MNGKYALNGNLILTPFRKSRELKTTEGATGFAMVSNKIGVEPLELLVDTVINLSDNGTKTIKKGSKIYFKEETLHTQKWSRAIFESDIFPDGFIVGQLQHVLFVEEQEE
jgi:hypothetical protein